MIINIMTFCQKIIGKHLIVKLLAGNNQLSFLKKG